MKCRSNRWIERNIIFLYGLSSVPPGLPALFISGSLDANTPPFQTEEVRWGFPNSVHLVVENGGHETLPAQEVQSVVVDFFKGDDVTTRRVSFPRPKFLSIEKARSSNNRRRLEQK